MQPPNLPNLPNFPNSSIDHALCALLADQLRQQRRQLVTAESCTGGLIAATCTDLAGSSDWFERGYVTYSNAAKTECLGVPQALLAEHGAVSAAVAEAMALGALRHSKAQLAVAVTGVAGPGGGSPSKPVGSVWFGFALRGQGPLYDQTVVHSELKRFEGDREAVRVATVNYALTQLLVLSQNSP